MLQEASITLHTILLGVGGTIYNNHMLELLRSWVFDSQRVKKLVSKLHVHSIDYAAKLVQPDEPFPTLIQYHQKTVSGQEVKPATLLIPIDLFLNVWWRSFTEGVI
jgi:hypothetical protein